MGDSSKGGWTPSTIISSGFTQTWDISFCKKAALEIHNSEAGWDERWVNPWRYSTHVCSSWPSHENDILESPLESGPLSKQYILSIGAMDAGYLRMSVPTYFVPVRCSFDVTVNYWYHFHLNRDCMLNCETCECYLDRVHEYVQIFMGLGGHTTIF